MCGVTKASSGRTLSDLSVPSRLLEARRRSAGGLAGQHDQVVAEDAQAHARGEVPKSPKQAAKQPKRSL